MTPPITIDRRGARRLALARGGLLPSRWSALPSRAAGKGRRARERALEVIRRFGYLQLDTVSVAGARSHAIVLLSRLAGLDRTLPETLLRPGEPLFEYWGHEASWLPMELYPWFGFRRRQFATHPWWGDLIGQNRSVANAIRARIRDEGPLRSVDLEGSSKSGWWNLKISKKVANALWSCGELAIRERSGFQRTYDLAERVIPESLRAQVVPYDESLKLLLEQALAGHGWATSSTLASTWRLRNCRDDLCRALAELEEEGRIVACRLQIGRDVGSGVGGGGGWILTRDLDLVDRLRRARPPRDRGVLLSPFDPVLWDRQRVKLLFGFDQVLEIFKPASQRVYGYYCMPVLAGERLVARVDLKAHRKDGGLDVRALHFEDDADAADRQAVRSAIERYASAAGLQWEGG